MKPVAPVAPADPIELHTVATLNELSGFATPGSVPEQAYADHDTYNYQNEPDLYELNDTDRQSLKLYEERLVANKKRIKT